MKTVIKTALAVTGLTILFVVYGCKEDAISPTKSCECDFVDSSAKHPKAQIYQSIINKYVAKGLPGVVLLINDANGTWIGAAGKADIEKGIDMQPCTVSKIASITKMMIGALTMKLVEEGTLSLDDPISKWLSTDELKDIANTQECRVRNLLNHTSGIYDVIKDNGFYLDVLNNPNRNWDYSSLLQYVRGKKAMFAFEQDAKYSNTNLLLAVMIIDKATGKAHSQVLRDKLFNSLGMKHSYYYYHEALPENVAQGYYDLYNNGTILNLSNYNTGSGNGYGGVYSTVKDMQLFAEALLKNKTYLSEQSLKTMLTFTKEDTEKHRSYGIGIFKDFMERPANEFAYGHRGRDLAYSADLDYFPNQNTTMALMVNYGTDGNTSLRDVFFEFRTVLADEICKK